MALLATSPAVSTSLQLTVEEHTWSEWPRVVGAWGELFARSAQSCVFLTPEFVTTWLREFGPRLKPNVLLFKNDVGAVVGACILVRRVDRKGPFHVRRVFLNTAGEDEADSPCIEYNELLCFPNNEDDVARALRRYVDRIPWDEFYADGLIEGPSHVALANAFGDAREVGFEKASYYIDLESVRAGKSDFIAKVAPRERTRIRQNLRKYEELGKLEIESARTVDQALLFLAKLAVLHQQTWRSRGRAGAFASEPFVAYHRNLIERCFPLGMIELSHVRAGKSTVGYHYNFVFGNRVYFYQCGYDYALGEKTSPGITAHALAIEQATRSGHIDYELMAGNFEYKRRLGTGARRMYWMVRQARTLKMASYEAVRSTRRSLRERIQALRGEIGKE